MRSLPMVRLPLRVLLRVMAVPRCNQRFRRVSRAVAVAYVLLLSAASATITRAQANAPPAPGAGTVAPTDATALLETVAQHQKQIEAARKDYIFHRLDEDQEFDAQGRVKTTEVKEYEVYYVGPWEIDRLLSKNGKPLAEGEVKKQDEEVRKQEAKARERIAKQASGEDPGKDAITIAKFLAADRFDNLRRDTFEGREVYAIDFTPRPDIKPHSLVDKILKAVGGTLWIDERAEQGVRLEARLLEGVKVGGGLVGSVQKGGNVVLEQRFVNGEVWLPSYVAVHLDAHVFFLHKSINGTSTYSDYRKFRVDTKISGDVSGVPAAKP